MFLLDTVAISEFAKPRINAGVDRWMADATSETQFVSVVVLGEIDTGIHLLPPGRRRDRLASWAVGLSEEFAGRILDFDLETARIWGRKTAELKGLGFNVPAVDVMIAATALQHGQTVVTRNQRHFEWCGVPVLNPWT